MPQGTTDRGLIKRLACPLWLCCEYGSSTPGQRKFSPRCGVIGQTPPGFYGGTERKRVERGTHTPPKHPSKNKLEQGVPSEHVASGNWEDHCPGNSPTHLLKRQPDLVDGICYLSPC
jgi:hypothetical protein